MSRELTGARVYRALLWVLPGELRRSYGDDMVRLFAHRLQRVRGRSRVTVWLRALSDLVRHGAAEHVRARRGSAHGGPRRPRPARRRTRDALAAVFHDLRFALRTWARSPAYAGIVVFTLALGIGATTTLFSVLYGVLLRPLPYPDAERMVYLQERDGEGRSLTVSYPNFDDWRARSETVTGMVAGYAPWRATLYGEGGARPVSVMGVSRGFFRVLGAETAIGRSILDEENTPSGAAAAVVSHAFWRDVLGAPESFDGVTLDLGGNELLPVVGVMQPGFRFLADVDVWIPFERGPTLIRNAHNHWVVGRLADGVTLDAARDELDAIAAAIKREYPDESQAVGVLVTPLQERLVGDSRQRLWVLMAASGLVLLVACTNVASTLLARGSARASELAMRRALGAGRARLVLQLLTESLLLAVSGAVAGLALAATLLRLLRASGAGRVPRLEEIGLDGTVLLASVAIVFVTAMLAGLGPALLLTRGDRSIAAAAAAGRATTSTPWRVLVGVEVALSVILLSGSGLLLRSLGEIVSADVGYERAGVMTVRFGLPQSRYDDAARVRLLDELESRIAALPGVQQVGLSNALPLAPGFKTGPGLVPPYADPEDPDEWDAFFRWRIADAGYFDALDLPLLRGRTFQPGDTEDAPGVVLLNRSLAEQLFPGEDPVGKRLRALWDFRGEDLTVIGVVDEARHWEREAGSQQEVYVPWRQRPEHADAMVAVVRSASPPAVLAAELRGAVLDLDPDLLAEVASLDEQFYETLGERAFNLQVLGGFALTALLLAAVGIYGVVSYSVSRRRREIGIRLAIGARPRDVVRMLRRYSLTAVLAGAALGGLGSLALAGVMEGLLYAVAPHDPASLLAAPAVLLLVAVLAGYMPSRRGTRVDPAITLRAE